MTVADILSVALLLAAGFFFLGGTVALLRFPDVFTRVHAVTKADNLGLGLLCLGLALQADSLAAAVKLLLIWIIVMIVGACAGNLVARHALARNGDERRTK
ncbi:MAG: monovalent cation/H(+) antiporter subunit G [Rhodospirillales bacterium]|nr:MAG: monovalent cation/H(+) antiporter subunit G [Rhodospirillales bacterium]